MSSNEWCKGFEDAMELAYVCVKDSKSIDEALKKIEAFMGSAKSMKYQKIRFELGVTDPLQP
ncbi:MAG: hypothetical protein QXG08_07200 [Candidatus Methanomethyliaceae archaeon]